MRTIFAPIIFVLHFCLQVTNLAFWALLIIALGLVKFVIPSKTLHRVLSPVMHLLMGCFGKLSVVLIKLFNPIKIEYNIKGELDEESWYLLIANHLSYLDIILLIEFAAFRIPAPKFFLKQELIWLPFVGLGAWALDMPFMRRYSREYLQKHPEKKGTDIDTTRKSCEKFKTMPTTVINFVEGTRYTPSKHKVKQSPFAQLLPPKAGGIAFTLATMGDLFTSMLDVTLLYPDNSRHPMIAMLSGQMRRVIIDVEVIDIPQEAKGDYYNDKSYRAQFQTWLNGLWEAKDKRIAQLLE